MLPDQPLSLGVKGVDIVDTGQQIKLCPILQSFVDALGFVDIVQGTDHPLDAAILIIKHIEDHFAPDVASFFVAKAYLHLHLPVTDGLHTHFLL